MNSSSEQHYEMPQFPAQDELRQPAFYTPYYPMPKKRKWVAGLLALLVPGTGHYYLGFMQRGLFFMMLIILDIFTITTLVTLDQPSKVPMVTLFALLIPVVYFYNIFDALQATDNVNRRLEFGEAAGPMQDPLQQLFRGNNMGILLVIVGVLCFLLSSKPRWFAGIFEMLGSYIGSIVLIVAGFVMFLLESRKNRAE
ncbi:DUF6677 family protein [Paenibacillus aestuarii]|uniref:DUF6677 family protein n=1 Tax=Paenibacillus aestuarii TaxID=516965 RepID=A0ABW0K9P4_9BACL|nr:DUF6677 family protein [Paenibacillus aestuarii]